MKIYCSTESEFDKFVGTDLWVMAKYHGGRYFIRFLSKSNYANERGYITNMVRTLCAGDDGFIHYSHEYELEYAQMEKLWCSAENLVLIKPIECYTTDELFIVD